MTNRLWPADAVGGAPAYSGRALRQTQAPFVAGATAARPLGARSGVRPGTTPATVTASSTTWSCTPHAGILDVQVAAEAGPYTYAVDATVYGAVTPSNASNPRVDIVYVQITDAAEDGAAPGQAPVVTIGYLAGTAAASPVAPATPARALTLARINVPKTGGGNPTVSWIAPYAVAAGGVGSYPTLDGLSAALTRTAPGELAYCLETDATYRRSNTGTLRWVRQGGGTFVGTLKQLIGGGVPSTLGTFTRDATYSDRDDFFTPSTRRLVEGDYVVSLTMALDQTSGTGRNFVGFSGGGAAARNGFAAGEDTVTVAAAIHVPAAGEALTLQAFLTVASGQNSPSFRLQITKVG